VFPSFNGGEIEFIEKLWTDHALLPKTYTVALTNNGEGIWHAKPNLTKYQH
jgi:hypothetical protein